ncbi:DUF732 domain-containing protein [Dietzia sp. B32]|uniref:DUF732 domain-containing protein n=1 Tax=Dietzia sp. B32 TaxID=2915130 RepID=UPI0021AE2498|nr:DUF732 domain-containing protein [Dietzia sp. B32]UVE95135.1 DUF732 domain-containing protein [Dietzia sp. B32]
MTDSRPRVLGASALVALAAVAGACGTGAEDPAGTMSTVAASGFGSESSEQLPPEDRIDTRTDEEQAFLADLSGFGLPTEMTAATTVEVGVGICRGIADGADTETILDRIRPLTSAIAAQTPDLDTAEVGRAIVDASRTHLCD